MTLPAGTKLGPYEILSPLGAGGMGEVYRARDTRLAREVAIKVLPEGLSSDQERLRRFEKEARSASALNHPTIVTIHDIGSEGGISYIAMELVDGATLRGLLESPLPLKKLLQIAPQIAEGLARAHEAGIVHRDLKPENVMLKKDGLVKILDFGLAKLSSTGSGSDEGEQLTTMTGTQPGVVVGTVGYMSPEQASGQPLDFRSDQFSLGAILYEMAAGRRAFQGSTAVQTLSAIIQDEPEPLSSAAPNLPASLVWIIERCLAKDPEERYACSKDLARDLAGLRDHVSGTAARLEAPTLQVWGRVPPLAVLAALLATLAIGLFAGHLIWNANPVSHPTYRRLTYGRGSVESARFAPDGQMIVYAAAWDGARKPALFSVRAESPESLRMALPAGQVESISRGGEMLLLNLLHFSFGMTRKGTLSQTPLSGSAPRDLLEDIGAADWSPDGSALAVVRAPNWRYRLEFPVGKVLYDTTGWISYPRVSPKGDSVAFLDHPVFGDTLGSVAIMNRSGKKRVLSTGWGNVRGLAWSASGEELLFTADKALYAVSLSGKQRTIATAPGEMMLQDVSRDGRVLLTQLNWRIGFLGMLPGETKERDFSGLDWSDTPLLSEDAKTVVFTEGGEGAGADYDTYLRKLDDSPAVRLGTGDALAISPDGKWVLTCLLRPAPAQIMLLPTGAGEPTTFPKDSIDHANGEFAAFLPDGKRIVFVGREPGRPARVFVQDLAGGAARPVSPEGVVARLLSADGKSLLITTEQGFALTPLEGGPSRAVPGLEPEDRPLRWAPGGRGLFVGHGRRELPARVFLVDTETGRRDVWREFMPADPAGIAYVGPWAISADGKTILFLYTRTLSELYLAEGLQ